MAAANHFRVLSLRFLQAGKMLFRNDEHVGWRFWVDVLESKNMFVLEDFFRWNFSAENAAEEAVNAGSVIAVHHGGKITSERSNCQRRNGYRYLVMSSAKACELTFHVPSKGLSRSV